MRIIFLLYTWLIFACFAYAEKFFYEVRVNAPTSEARTILEENLDIITQRTLDDLDQDQVDVMVEDTPEQAQNFLKTIGYFSSSVTVHKQDKTYVVDVELGAPITVTNVEVLIDGDILQDEQLADRYLKVMENWQLPVGKTFTQDDWSGSKDGALRSITAEHYPLAKMTHSKAEINPETKSANLSVSINSSRFMRFGDITVEGAKRYPEKIAKNLADFEKGTPYTLEKLLLYQNRLEQDGHYANASVGPRFDQIRGSDTEYVPLTVQIEEVLRQKLEAGLRYDTEEGITAKGGYSYYNVFNKGFIGELSGKFGNYEQSAAVGLSSPRDENGYFYTGNTSFENSEWQKLKTKSVSASTWRVRQRGDIEAKLGLEYLRENSRLTNGEADFGTSEVLLVRYGWIQRKLDSNMRPQNGYLLDFNAAITPGTLASSAQVGKLDSRAIYYYTPKKSKIGTFILHGEIGHVFVEDKNRDKIPQSLMFRTGGANSVRGYEYQSIGIDLPGGAVIGGDSMAVVSLEYQYPITKTISLAVFHDEGAVNNNFDDLKFENSNGFGVRWFSPVAPLSIDVGHATRDNKWRWNLSLGLAF